MACWWLKVSKDLESGVCAYVEFPNLRAEPEKNPRNITGHDIPNNNHYEICGMCNFSFNGSTAQVVQSFFCDVPRSLTVTPHSSGSVMNPSQRPLPDNTQYYQKTSMTPGGFRTGNPSKRPAAHPCVRPCGHRDRREYVYVTCSWIKREN